MFQFKTLSLLLIFLAGTFSPALSQTLEEYLPEGISYNPEIPTPASVIGHEVGEFHVSHDKLVHYMKALAASSDRVTLEERGRTYENRFLLLLTITSEENHTRIDQIREQQQALADPERSGELNLESMPVVVNLAYSIHGNEPSGSNASMLVAYHLTAAMGEEINELLQNSVVLLDPSQNPDGMNRFASWVNRHKSRTPVTDPSTRELNEVWPTGRTNHYWFDLNRDWLPAQHPASRARVETYQHWKPNILGDFHEMRSNDTYYFQPGPASRVHPLTPQQNQDLTLRLARYHADALEEHQQLFFTGERYDDFYYGKGSSYPDIQGSLGILYEQSSSRGHARETAYGIKTFPETIRNQFSTSLSTLRGAYDLRLDLHTYMREFYRESVREGRDSDIQAYLFGDSNDRARTWHMADMLASHQIQMHKLARDVQAGGETFRAGEAFLIETDQPQFRLIESLFEQRTAFPDSIFYDISSWSLPQAMNMPYAELDNRAYDSELTGERVVQQEKPEGRLIGGQSSYSYLFQWDNYYAPRLLYKLQKAGVRALVTSAPFRTSTDEGSVDFSYGAIQVPLGVQDQVEPEEIHRMLRESGATTGVDVYAVHSGLSEEGADLGSPGFTPLRKPEVALIVGRGTNSYEAGEVWHLMDQRMGIPLSLLEQQRISSTDLDRYNVLVMVSGNYSTLGSRETEKIRNWVRLGRTLILIRQALNWGIEQELANVAYKEESYSAPDDPKLYADLANSRGAEVIGGAIFHGRLDPSHPIGYGFRDSSIRIFRNSTLFLKREGNNPFATPLVYEENPLSSGYISERNLELLSESASIVVSSQGSGRVISMVDNPNFRAFWFGTNKLFLNAVFFGQTIESESTN